MPKYRILDHSGDGLGTYEANNETRIYKMPDGAMTENCEKYAQAWHDLGERVLELFPGYVIAGYDPDIIFEFREIGKISNTYKVSDRFQLSPRAINALLAGTVLPKLYREDF